MSGRRRICTEDAGDVYTARTGRDWRTDSAVGLMMAVVAEAGDRLPTALVDEGRIASGGTRLKDRGPLPDWFEHGLAVLRELASKVSGFAEHPVVRILTDPAAAELRDALLLDRREGAGPALFTESEVQPLAHAAEAVVRRQAPYRRRQEPKLAFYVATRGWFRAQHGAEPTPSEVALLAAACGLEPLEGGLDRTRKRWEDRIRRWREQDDRWASDRRQRGS